MHRPTYGVHDSLDNTTIGDPSATQGFSGIIVVGLTVLVWGGERLSRTQCVRLIEVC